MSLPFAWEARPMVGEVRVLPGLAVHDPLEVARGAYFEDILPDARQRIRAQRTDDLRAIPAAVGLALPGAMNARLGTSWQGSFRAAEWPAKNRARLSKVLRSGGDPTRALHDLGRAVGGDAVLVSWVDQLNGDPLSMQGFPGDVVNTPHGQVVIDHQEEHYAVVLRVGMAVVASDGEVVLRYRDDLTALLSEAHPPDAVGRDVAEHVAEEVMKVWAQ